MKKIQLIIFLIFLTVSTGKAQRMFFNQSAIQLSVAAIDGFRFSEATFSLAGAIQYSMYKKNGQWLAIAEYSSFRSKYKNSYIPYSQITGEGGYVWRIVSNYRKSVVLYVGLTAMIGHESVNNGNSQISPGEYITAKSKFIYGISPLISLDIFCSNRLAINLNIKEKFSFGSDVTINHTFTSIGIKYLLN